MRATVVLPGLKTVSLTNQREHWRSRSARAKSQRRAVAAAWPRGTWNTDQLPVGSVLVVTLTRISPRELDDDNLRGALKSVRDQVAACLYLDDRDKRFVWLYAQEKGATGVRIEVTDMVDPAAIATKIVEAARS
jgi:hypothetical protein